MLIALDQITNERIKPTPKARAKCQCCDDTVMSKCGSIVTWHWSHLPGSLCTGGGEKMTEWHYQWQQLFPSEQQEIFFADSNGERHRADVHIPVSESQPALTIEFQHSSISCEEVQQREAFYGSIGELVWVFDTSAWTDKILTKIANEKYLLACHTRPSIFAATNVALDLGDNRVMIVTSSPSERGWRAYQGLIVERYEFVSNPTLHFSRAKALVAEEQDKIMKGEAAAKRLREEFKTYICVPRGYQVKKSGDVSGVSSCFYGYTTDHGETFSPLTSEELLREFEASIGEVIHYKARGADNVRRVLAQELLEKSRLIEEAKERKEEERQFETIAAGWQVNTKGIKLGNPAVNKRGLSKLCITHISLPPYLNLNLRDCLYVNCLFMSQSRHAINMRMLSKKSSSYPSRYWKLLRNITLRDDWELKEARAWIAKHSYLDFLAEVKRNAKGYWDVDPDTVRPTPTKQEHLIDSFYDMGTVERAELLDDGSLVVAVRNCSTGDECYDTIPKEKVRVDDCDLWMENLVGSGWQEVFRFGYDATQNLRVVAHDTFANPDGGDYGHYNFSRNNGGRTRTQCYAHSRPEFGDCWYGEEQGETK